MAERKGQVFVDERAIIVQLRWVWGTSEQEAVEHFTYPSGADSSIILKFIALRVERAEMRWSVFLVASL